MNRRADCEAGGPMGPFGGAVGRRTFQVSRAFWLSAAFLLVLVFQLTGCGPSDPTTESEASSDSVTWQGGVVDLRGRWDFRVDGATDPSLLPAPDSVDWSPRSVPAPFDLDLPRPPGGVVTWWHREVALAPPNLPERPALGVTLGKINSAYELWAGPRHDSHFVGSVGWPSGSEAGSDAGSGAGAGPVSDYDRHAVWPLPDEALEALEDGTVDLWLRIWTDPEHGAGGGPHESPFRFGDLARLVRDEATSELPQLFLSGLFLLLGLFHIELFRRRHEERGYLWLGVVACLFAAYSFLRTQWKYTLAAYLPWLSFDVLKETEHVVAFAMVAAFVQLIWTLLELKRSAPVRAAQGLCLVFALVVAVTPSMTINHHLLVVWQILLVLLTARGLYLVLQEAWQKNPDAHLTTIGAILGTVAFLHDVLVEREVLHTPRLTAFGFGVFVAFLAATLAEQFARRLREIEELRSSEEAAERANRAKSQFLANVSHEIRTPMTAILGGTELLLRDDLGQETKQRIEVIQRSAADLLEVIDDILDVSKIEAGKLQLRPDDFRPKALVEGVIALFLPEVRRRGVLLSAEESIQVPAKVRTDPGRVRQILLNLVSNAVKFTDEGSVTIRVEYLVSSSIRGDLEITVADTGVGIDPEILPRLFEPFSQADESNSRRVGGTGLGLTISRRLATLMGGKLEVESRLGHGSTFVLTLPVENSNGTSTEIKLLDLGHGAARTHRILLAEDNEVNRLIVTEQLQYLGFDVESAGSGLEVLERLERQDRPGAQPVELVLMDCQMPELDGYETTRRIRAKESESGGRRLPILALTAHAFEGERDRCLDAGMDDYLSKPFRIGELKDLLDRWLTRSA